MTLKLLSPPVGQGEPDMGTPEFELAADLARLAARFRDQGWRVAFACDFGEVECLTFSASRGERERA